MSEMRATLHRLRGFVASLEDGMGVNGVVQQPWIDEAYRLVDVALAEVKAMERVVEAARTAQRILDTWVLASDDGPEITTRAEVVLVTALAELDGQTHYDRSDDEGTRLAHHRGSGSEQPPSAGDVGRPADHERCPARGERVSAGPVDRVAVEPDGRSADAGLRRHPPVDHSACPCRVHGDTDGDCGEECA